MNNITINKPPRMKTIPQTAIQLKADDINVGEYRLRLWVKHGIIPVVRCGRKCLINYDMLLDYLRNGEVQ